MSRVGIGGCEDAAAETVTLEHTEREGEVAALGRASYERHEAGGAVRWDGDGELSQHGVAANCMGNLGKKCTAATWAEGGVITPE